MTLDPCSSHEVGELPTEVVATLSGVKRSQLDSWHRRGLIQASAAPGRRGVRRLYSWSDYLRIRAIAKLLDCGFPPHRLRAVVDRLDTKHRAWYLIPLSDTCQPPPPVLADDDESNPASIPQFADFAAVAADLPPEVDVERFWSAQRREGALGRLYQFADGVDMNPWVLGGAPRIRDRRIETYEVAVWRREMSIEAICDGWRLQPEEVRRALQFERAYQELQQTSQPPYAPAAG